MKCALCKRGNTRPTEYRERLTVAGHAFTASLPATTCDACGEVMIDGPSVGRFELAAARMLMDAGEASGETFRFARKTLALTAVETATILGTTPETVSRWETGKRGVDSTAMAVLAMLVRDAAAGSTANLDMLRARRGAKPLPKRVALKLATRLSDEQSGRLWKALKAERAADKMLELDSVESAVNALRAGKPRKKSRAVAPARTRTARSRAA